MSDILDELTAKEIAEEALGAMEFAKENPDLWVQDLESRINQYTLSIIEKAVGEERKQIRAEGVMFGAGRESAYKAILARIKTLTENGWG